MILISLVLVLLSTITIVHAGKFASVESKIESHPIDNHRYPNKYKGYKPYNYNYIYNDTVAAQLTKYAGAAYCCGTLGNGCADWTCKACRELPMTNTTVIINRKTQTNGFVGIVADNALAAGTTRKSIVVSFAGTDPLQIKNWIDDLNAFKTTFPACEESNCRVHEGFYNSYLSVQDDVRAAVQAYLGDHNSNTATTDNYSGVSIHVVGHSLGGALAVLATADLLTQGYNVSSLYTFGQPRVGDDKFAAFLKTWDIMPTLYRIVHNRDPVPHLPFQTMGYKHGPYEIFYNEKNADFQICDSDGEDKHCSNQYTLGLNLLDHLNYMNFSFTSNYLSCKL